MQRVLVQGQVVVYTVAVLRQYRFTDQVEGSQFLIFIQVAPFVG